MNEIIKTINSIMYTLDSIHIKGRITENAEAYNQIIACINSLAQVTQKLGELVEENHEENQTA